MSATCKRFWSYEQVHDIVRKAVMEDSYFDDWRPTLIICIAAGGFVPTRILRSFMQTRYGHNIPIQTIGLQLYDLEGKDPATSPVERKQWLVYGTGPGQVQLQGHRILIVDEVDDSRKTLAHAVSELESDVEAEMRQHNKLYPGQPWHAPELGVFVLHNKLRPKLADLPQHISHGRYWAFDIENCWCVYPWDAMDIYEHTQIAEAAGLPDSGPCQGGRAKRQSSGCPLMQRQERQQESDGQHIMSNLAAGSEVGCSNGQKVANGCALVSEVNGHKPCNDYAGPAARANAADDLSGDGLHGSNVHASVQ